MSNKKCISLCWIKMKSFHHTLWELPCYFSDKKNSQVVSLFPPFLYLMISVESATETTCHTYLHHWIKTIKCTIENTTSLISVLITAHRGKQAHVSLALLLQKQSCLETAVKRALYRNNSQTAVNSTAAQHTDWVYDHSLSQWSTE